MTNEELDDYKDDEAIHWLTMYDRDGDPHTVQCTCDIGMDHEAW